MFTQATPVPESRPRGPARPIREQGHVKGVAVRALLQWYERRSHFAGVARLYDALPLQVRAAVQPKAEALGILPSSWVPDTTYHAILDAMLDAPPCDLTRMTSEGAGAIMGATLKGVYKQLFEKLATPQL